MQGAGTYTRWDTSLHATQSFEPRRMLLVFLAVSAWVNVSEVFRYFVIVIPRMRAFLPTLPGAAPMDWTIFMIWGAWDTLLVLFNLAITVLVIRAGERGLRAALLAGSISALLFVLFWIAIANMALAPWTIMLWTLPLAWIEMLIASRIAVALLTTAPAASAAAGA